jgi:hypothetical protein
VAVDSTTGSTVDFDAWTEHVRRGTAHFQRVNRSWGVFAGNADELLGLLAGAETHPEAWTSLIGTSDEPEYRTFWLELGRRLHNTLAAADGAVDGTVPLIGHYGDQPDFGEEWTRRRHDVASSLPARFLRDFRDYLLDVGKAPVAESVDVGATDIDPSDAQLFTIHASAAGLLEWHGWTTAAVRRYIESFEPGPPLRLVASRYVDDMRALFHWLFSTFNHLHVPGVPPTRFVS